MLIAALETSSAHGSIAILKTGHLLECADFQKGLVHGREITIHLQEVLNRIQLLPADLQGLAVSVGPGSYTGIRVGVTVAKSLAFALQIPVLAVSSLEVMAQNALSRPQEGGRESTLQEGDYLAAVLDGRQGHLYRALFQKRSTGLERILEDGLEEASRLMDECFPGIPCQAVLIGDGADLARERTVRPGSTSYPRGPSSWDRPRADQLGRLALDRISRHPDLLMRGEEIHRLEPVYLRSSEAERRWRPPACGNGMERVETG